MNKDFKEIITQYGKLKYQEKEIKAKLEELAPTILSEIRDDQEIQTEGGKFYITIRKKFKYSPAIEAAEANLKDQKKMEEARGIATELDPLRVLNYKSNSVKAESD
jgi:hypothetical protein